MRLTVLGSSASYAGAGQACAGYLIDGGGARVLFDCGNGVLSNLARVIDPLTLDAVFVTHLHPDHFADLFALQALLRYAPSGPAPALPLYLPEGLWDRLLCLLSDRGARELEEAFVAHTLASGVDYEVGGLRVVAAPIEHTDPTFALRASADGAVLAYTADSSPGPHVAAAASGADLLLAEATLPEAYEGAAPHLTATQAGRYAREAGVGRLVLTHIWPTNDREETRRLAATAFGGPVDVASELDTFDITPREEPS